MKYLLDTSVFLWLVGGDEHLNTEALKILREKNTDLFLSAISVWEVTVKARAGGIKLQDAPAAYFQKWQSVFRLTPLPLSPRHALEVWELPNHHKDPFDRMLIAQARVEEMTLLTSDRMVMNYPVHTLWCGK